MAGVGLAYGLITPPTNVIVSGAPTTRHRSLLMSVKQVGVTIGGFIAGITMPVIAHQWGWRLALLAPALACAAVSLAALREPPHARAQCRRGTARTAARVAHAQSCPAGSRSAWAASGS